MHVLRAIVTAAMLAAVLLAGVGCSPGTSTPSQSAQSSVPPPPSPIPPSLVPGIPVAQSPTTPVPVPVVAAAPPSSAAAVEMIANGSFRRWDEGQIAPRHWTIGYGYRVDEMPFKLEPLEDSTYSDGRAVRQTWLGNDTAIAFQKVFGQTIDGLEPDTIYRLDVIAQNDSKNRIIISAFAMEGFKPGWTTSGKPTERLKLNVVQIPPETGMAAYTGMFKTNESGAVKLGARIEGKDPVLPGSVVWDSWSLSEKQ